MRIYEFSNVLRLPFELIMGGIYTRCGGARDESLGIVGLRQIRFSRRKKFRIKVKLSGE